VRVEHDCVVTRVLRTTDRYVFRAGHPGWRRCSFLKYAQYSRSSRLASRAPRSGSRVPIRRAQDTSHGRLRLAAPADRQGLEEGVGELDLILERACLPRGQSAGEGHEPRVRFAALGDDDLFARVRLVEQPREVTSPSVR
jgi:hypothetical protein